MPFQLKDGTKRAWRKDGECIDDLEVVIAKGSVYGPGGLVAPRSTEEKQGGYYTSALQLGLSRVIIAA